MFKGLPATPKRQKPCVNHVEKNSKKSLLYGESITNSEDHLINFVDENSNPNVKYRSRSISSEKLSEQGSTAAIFCENNNRCIDSFNKSLSSYNNNPARPNILKTSSKLNHPSNNGSTSVGCNVRRIQSDNLVDKSNLSHIQVS